MAHPSEWDAQCFILWRLTPISVVAPNRSSKTPNVHFRFLSIKKENLLARRRRASESFVGQSLKEEREEGEKEGGRGRKKERRREGEKERRRETGKERRRGGEKDGRREGEKVRRREGKEGESQGRREGKGKGKKRKRKGRRKGKGRRRPHQTPRKVHVLRAFMHTPFSEDFR